MVVGLKKEAPGRGLTQQVKEGSAEICQACHLEVLQPLVIDLQAISSLGKVSTLLALTLVISHQAGVVTWRCCSHLGLTCRRSPSSFRVKRSTSPMPSSSSCSNDQAIRQAASGSGLLFMHSTAFIVPTAMQHTPDRPASE